MQTKLIVCERDGEWASVCRREDWSVVEVTSWDDCLDEVDRTAGPVTVLVDLARVPPEQLIASQDRIDDARPELLLIVAGVGELPLAACLYELGVTLILSSFPDVSRLKRVVLRHIQRFEGEPLSLEERIWNNLPWPSANVAEDGF